MNIHLLRLYINDLYMINIHLMTSNNYYLNLLIINILLDYIQYNLNNNFQEYIFHHHMYNNLNNFYNHHLLLDIIHHHIIYPYNNQFLYIYYYYHKIIHNLFHFLNMYHTLIYYLNNHCHLLHNLLKINYILNWLQLLYLKYKFFLYIHLNNLHHTNIIYHYL